MNKHILLGVTVCLSMLIAAMYVAKKSDAAPAKAVTNWPWSNEWDNKSSASTPLQAPKIEAPVEKVEAPVEVKPEQLVAKTYQEALEMAKKENKQILIFFTADWCGWCVKMKSETLSDASVKEAMKAYVFLMVDVTKDPATQQKFQVRGLPSNVIIDANENVLKSKSGFMKADAYVGWLTNAAQKGRFLRRR